MPDVLRFNGAVARDAAIEEWIATHAVELQDIAARWLRVMRGQGPDVRELMHDGLATLCVHGAPFAYVGIFTSHVNVGFFRGATLPDPENLMTGTGRSMRHVKLAPSRAVDARALEALIAAAYHDIRTVA